MESPELSTSKTTSRGELDLEFREAPTISRLARFPKVKRKLQLSQSNFRFIATCNCLILLGWNDGATGALIPHIQRQYNISYLIVSLLFLGQFVGNITGAQLSVILTKRFGIGKLFAASALIQGLGYVLVAATAADLPFPLIAVAFAISGFGITIQDALGNQFTAGLPSVALKMGILHTAYGIGAFLSPLVATAFVNAGNKWNFFYLIGLALAILNFGLLALSFKFEAEYETANSDTIELEETPRPENTNELDQNPAYNQQEPRRLQQHVSILQAIKLRAVYSGVVLFFLYVGAEVAQSGWIVSYLIQFRGGGSDAGYVSSGFFAGLAVSRIIMVPVNLWVGEQNVLYYYFALSLGMEFIVMFVPNFVGDAVAVAIVGFAMGPVYPSAMSVLSKLLPRSYHSASIGLMASAGCVGSAVVPFMIGALSEKHSTKVLQPFMIAMFAAMAVAWAFVPRLRKVSD